MVGWSASTNQSEMTAAPMARGREHADREAQRPRVAPSAVPIDRRALAAARASTGSRPRRSTSRTIDTNTEISTAWPRSGPPGAVETVGIASAATARTSSDRDRPDRGASNTWRPLLQAAGEEGEAQHEQAVAQDRADQRRLREDHEALLQGEDRDEQLGQVAQRRLEDAGRARPEVVPRCRCPRRPGPASTASVTAATMNTARRSAPATLRTAVSDDADDRDDAAIASAARPSRPTMPDGCWADASAIAGHSRGAPRAPCQFARRSRIIFAMSLRHHEIAEANHRILDPFTEPKLRLLGDVSGVAAGTRVLDLACGKGEMLCRWAEWFGSGGLGVDLSPVFLAAAVERAAELGVGDRVTFLQGDAGAYEPEPAAFDIGACIGATWIGGGLAGTVDLLRPAIRRDGRLLIGEPYWTEPPPDEAVEALGFAPDEFVVPRGHARPARGGGHGARRAGPGRRRQLGPLRGGPVADDRRVAGGQPGRSGPRRDARVPGPRPADLPALGPALPRLGRLRHPAALSDGPARRLGDHRERDPQALDLERMLRAGRAGGSAANQRCHSSFMPAKSSAWRRMNRTLTTFAIELPAARRIASQFRNAWRVCSWIVSPTIAPVAGSNGPCRTRTRVRRPSRPGCRGTCRRRRCRRVGRAEISAMWTAHARGQAAPRD